MGPSSRNSDMFALVENGGEPRVRDLEIAERLAMARPTNIRQVIEANRAEIEGFGVLHAAHATSPMPNGGFKKVTEFHLNEEQALCVSTLSNAPRAPEVRGMLIRTFTAFRRGELDNSLGVLARVERIIDEKMALVSEKLALLEERSEQRRLNDDRIALREFQSALEIIREYVDVPAKGRRKLVGKCSASLRDFCATESEETGQDFGPRRCARTRTWLFPVGVIRKWWKLVGRTLVHNFLIVQRAKDEGQNVFPFVQDKKGNGA